MKTVEIYTYRTCPYCVRAKELLDQEGINYAEYIVSYSELKSLEKRTGCDTVPQILVDDKFIGGCDDLYDLYRAGKFSDIFGEV